MRLGSDQEGQRPSPPLSQAGPGGQHPFPGRACGIPCLTSMCFICFLVCYFPMQTGPGVPGHPSLRNNKSTVIVFEKGFCWLCTKLKPHKPQNPTRPPGRQSWEEQRVSIMGSLEELSGLHRSKRCAPLFILVSHRPRAGEEVGEGGLHCSRCVEVSPQNSPYGHACQYYGLHCRNEQRESQQGELLIQGQKS